MNNEPPASRQFTSCEGNIVQLQVNPGVK